MKMSVFGLVANANITVQMVMLLLVLMSMWSWTIIFDKLVKFKLLKSKSDKFEDFFKNNAVLEEIYSHSKEKNDHPLARVFVACMKEWKSNNIKQIILDPAKKSSLKERLASVMEIAAKKSTEKLEQGLGFLAITGSVAPFIGLFGTVFGIMNSFQSIAVSKNTSLSVVAPGIAESLLATGIGLFAAIPAVFFYNVFVGKINSFQDNLQSFSAQLINIFSKELDR